MNGDTLVQAINDFGVPVIAAGMLDNDMIRLNTKIQMILQEKEQKEEEERKENRKRNRHIVDTKL